MIRATYDRIARRVWRVRWIEPRVRRVRISMYVGGHKLMESDLVGLALQAQLMGGEPFQLLQGITAQTHGGALVRVELTYR
jgi:hypothetical protein